MACEKSRKSLMMSLIIFLLLSGIDYAILVSVNYLRNLSNIFSLSEFFFFFHFIQFFVKVTTNNFLEGVTYIVWVQ